MRGLQARLDVIAELVRSAKSLSHPVHIMSLIGAVAKRGITPAEARGILERL